MALLMQILRDYFLDIRSARLSRGRFSILFIGLLVVAFVLAILLGAGIGITERFAPGLIDILKSQVAVTRASGLLVLLVFFVSALAIIWAKINLVAKRARDIGWNPIFITVLYLVLTGITGLGLLMALVLAIIPSRSKT
jgi:uncharacterized membrane protein YhaH (DUF805 family)